MIGFLFMTIDVDSMPLDDGDLIRRLLRRYYPLILGRSYLDASEMLNMGIDFDLDNPLIQEVLGELLTELGRVPETTLEEIRVLIGKQAAEGWSISELAEAIRKRGEIASVTRSEVIARTETAAAYSKGSILAYQESGVVEAIEWLATIDDQTSEGCRALNGTRAPLGKPFADGTKHPPRHPNCRCAIIPIVKD